MLGQKVALFSILCYLSATCYLPIWQYWLVGQLSERLAGTEMPDCEWIIPVPD
jgi:hypothetical protein